MNQALPPFVLTGVEFGARMITIDGKQIKLQIWDTVRLQSSDFSCFLFVQVCFYVWSYKSNSCP